MSGVKRVKYKTDNNSIFNVILDEASGMTAFIGTLPTEAYTENMTVRVSKNNKEVGIRPRSVLLSRTIGDDTITNCLVQQGTRYKRVPIPTKARWDEIGLTTAVTIGGQAYVVEKKISEDVK